MSSEGGAAGSMKAEADRGACCGYGVCAEICPEVFKLDEAGLVYIDDALIAPELVERAIEAVESCPQLAIRVVPAEASA